MRHRQRLSESLEISTRVMYYLILGENKKAITLAEMQYELQPNNISCKVVLFIERLSNGICADRSGLWLYIINRSNHLINSSC